MKLFVATRNQHKLAELRALLGPVAGKFKILTAGDLPDMPDVVEDAPTLEGNAVKKATETAAHAKKTLHGETFVVIADDTGLEVDALDGAPGVWSARFAQFDGLSPRSKVQSSKSVSYQDNNAKLLWLLAGVPPEKRTARFRCVIAIAQSDKPCVIVEGVCEGVIGHTERGANGFGYDPLFIPLGYDKTFAEVTEVEKNRISHRGKALQRACEALARIPA